jgi:hypothetical protein
MRGILLATDISVVCYTQYHAQTTDAHGQVVVSMSKNRTGENGRALADPPVSHKGSRKFVSTDIRVDLSKWRDGEVTCSYRQAAEINAGSPHRIHRSGCPYEASDGPELGGCRGLGWVLSGDEGRFKTRPDG